jgi:hypothetical protein
MLSNAVTELKSRQAEIAATIKGLEKESRQIAKAIAALSQLGGAGKGRAKAGKPAGKRKKMSRLGRLRIKLGSLNRYGKKAAAKKLAARIAALEAKAK